MRRPYPCSSTTASSVRKFWESFMHVGEKCLELAGARRLAQLAQGLGFDLANALAGDGERPANLLQRMLRAILQTRAHLHDRLRSRGSGSAARARSVPSGPR